MRQQSTGFGVPNFDLFSATRREAPTVGTKGDRRFAWQRICLECCGDVRIGPYTDFSRSEPYAHPGSVRAETHRRHRIFKWPEFLDGLVRKFPDWRSWKIPDLRRSILGPSGQKSTLRIECQSRDCFSMAGGSRISGSLKPKLKGAIEETTPLANPHLR